MVDYTFFELEDLIKMYAAIVQDPMLDSERASIHFAICEKLGIEHEEFSPFEGNTALSLLSEGSAERMIRAEIARVKK